jgi:hypothetical protein
VVSTQVRVFVQTRGTARATDYAFLGGAPPEPWWRAYRDATAFDHPTLLVRSDGAAWAAYLSGIPSARVDAVGTVVRYTLVAEGPCGVADDTCVAAAAAAWLDDVADSAEGRPGSRLSGALDTRFPLADVQRWLTPDATGRLTVAAEVHGRALAALATLPAPAPVTNADTDSDWIGAVAAPATRAAFTARVAALLAGAPGRALLLNLVGGPDDVAPLLDPASPVAVLVESSDPQLAWPTALPSVVEAKKAQNPPSRVVAATGAATAAGIAVAPLMVAMLVLVLLVTALIATVLVLVS